MVDNILYPITNLSIIDILIVFILLVITTIIVKTYINVAVEHKTKSPNKKNNTVNFNSPTNYFINYTELANATKEFTGDYVDNHIIDYLDTGVLITSNLYYLLLNEQIITR